MSLIDDILSRENLNRAFKRVKANKGCAGIDNMPVSELKEYIMENRELIITSIREKKYKPQPVKRVYIPKADGKQRPLGIPTAIDRVIQQAIAQQFSVIYEPIFSEYSYGFSPNRDCHKAMAKVLEYLNEGYEWIVDFDIEKFFDTVNQDKLISILREQVKEDITLNLVRKFLKAGVMENGLTKSTEEGMPQGGPLSPILSNIYLDKLDKELESRELRFVRYADDFIILVKSEKAAERVMASVTSWVERKLFLKVSATKTKVTRPANSKFLGFTFLKDSSKWECKPAKDRIVKFEKKIKDYLCRRKAIARTLAETFTKLNQIIRGWINYFKIGRMKQYLKEKFGPWLRHKIRVVIIKQWKKPRTIYTNLMRLNIKYNNGFSEEDIFKVANSRLGLYRRAGMDVVNFILSPKILEKAKGDRPALVNPLAYYSK